MITENVVINSEYSWIDIETPLKVDFDFLKTEFELPLLLVQDCIKPAHLPKYERTEKGHFILCRAFDPLSKRDDITVQKLTNKIALFITESRVISIHNVEVGFLRRYAANGHKSSFPRSIHSLVHQILRSLIKSYEEPIVGLQDSYEEFEHEILSKNVADLRTNRVYQFRRKLFILRGVLKQIQGTLLQGKDFWGESHHSLLQDLREDIEQLYYRLDDISHNFDQLFALYLSMNDQRNNEVMKILTTFASILLPITFISSFYGMGFDYLPGKKSPLGPWIVTILMASMSLATMWYFKKKGWYASSEK